MVQQRARNDEQRAERRQAILAAAGQAFATTGYAALTMAELAERVGLSKGTLYLYFPTKEALFLALVEERLECWFDAIDHELGGVGVDDGDAVAALIVTTLRAQPGLARLLAILSTVLEQNVTLEEALHFKQLLLRHITYTGMLFEERLSGLGSGHGPHLILRIHALIVGIHHLADAAPVVREVLAREELSMFRVDFDAELLESVRILIRGSNRVEGEAKRAILSDGDHRVYRWKGGGTTRGGGA